MFRTIVAERYTLCIHFGDYRATHIDHFSLAKETVDFMVAYILWNQGNPVLEVMLGCSLPRSLLLEIP
jgi:hypothetical protein